MRGQSKEPIFLVIRRGRTWWEVRFREENDSKFKTTNIPVKPFCMKPARCKFCDGVRVQGTLIIPPLLFPPDNSAPYHNITPPIASHLVAFEWGMAHPTEPFTVAWLLTDEEREAGRTGVRDDQVP